MLFKNNSRLVAVVALIGCLAPLAHGSIVSSTLGGSAVAGQNYVNFDDLALGAGGGTALTPAGSVGVSFNTDGQVLNLPVSGVAAPPFLSGLNDLYFQTILGAGVDGTNYVTSGAVPSTAAAILTWTSGQRYLGILWGSVDDYNVLDFYDAGGALIESVTGAQAIAFPNGDQGLLGTRYVNINITTANPFVTVVARSNGRYAFEFDNVAYGANPVPEAATIAVWSGLSLIGLGAYGRRAKLA